MAFNRMISIPLTINQMIKNHKTPISQNLSKYYDLRDFPQKGQNSKFPLGNSFPHLGHFGSVNAMFPSSFVHLIFSISLLLPQRETDYCRYYSNSSNNKKTRTATKHGINIRNESKRSEYKSNNSQNEIVP